MIGGIAVAFGGGAVLQGELVAAPSVGSDALLHLQRSVVGACLAITVLCKSYSKLKLQLKHHLFFLSMFTLSSAAPSVLGWSKKENYSSD